MQANQARPLNIRAADVTAETARADWTGETAQARFEGAAQADRYLLAYRPGYGYVRAFGRKESR